MSRTMDKDAQMAYDRLSYETLTNNGVSLSVESNKTPLEQLQAAEIERQRQAMDWSDAQHDKIKGKLEDANDTLRARVEELESQAVATTQARDAWKADFFRIEKELANLAQLNGHNKAEADRAHVQTLALQERLGETERRASKTTKELTILLDEANAQLAAANEKLAALQADLTLTQYALDSARDGLQPQPATVVKQTWQNVYGPGSIDSGTMRYSRRDADNMAGPTRVAVLCLDHYSDGTVKATLEQIGETK